MYLSHRAPWLRALLLGANDGLVSTAALLIGVTASVLDTTSRNNNNNNNSKQVVLITGMAGLVAGAMSMAVGEFISVSGQRDAELGDIEKERLTWKLAGSRQKQRKLDTLAKVYQDRGLSPALALQVAQELCSGKNPSEAHIRDVLGIDTDDLANPWTAAIASCCSFSIGAGLPLLSVAFVDEPAVQLILTIVISTITLAVFGGLGAFLGGASIVKGVLRVSIGGLVAMAVTFIVGYIFGVTTSS